MLLMCISASGCPVAIGSWITGAPSSPRISGSWTYPHVGFCCCVQRATGCRGLKAASLRIRAVRWF